MDIAQLLIDAYGRINDGVHEVLSGMGEEEVLYRPDGEANSIAWMVWHLTRVEDDHVAHVAGTEQVWINRGFAERFALPFDPLAHGYGQSPEETAQVRTPPALLLEYQDAVHEEVVRYLATLSADDLDRVVDDRWDPPVTLGVRLVSVIGDALQHIGQCGYVKGLAERA